ncbi:carboxymuconolactone decarboxylase family protein [Mycolicibacterium thermoresistibile]|uniref:Carboxymuconolactone decarboxylase n=2 Tax=Mycolicibacterium thermoresistibile TaxID=1797 RepID=G7CJV5_MYCT3|nr:carboxymuconolactone decarboxylase family protein [Mycolicibacterium thermoresistibile]EHI12823.1 carboxymuconolactone decarboxylase [Mycolicibacterium thermoresistibile ATCC 19527]MCV7189920.1 carboxymuconolactone decarboxylase family protein [Mycolicibacterium thermoresistibile]GAT14027.1 carboxymuconolactone decarboxylase [Mycolicibacterium thermoresistibile]SNW19199.1 carboxymuconolactone decarboxylase [Mycolicibacterium thermoresistibile]
MTRLSPLPAEEWTDEVRRSLAPLLAPDRANPRDAGNVLATLVRHPALTRAYLEFNAYLLRDSTLSTRTREVAVLRVVLLRDCEYLWEHHIPLAQRAGLTPAEIVGIRNGRMADEPDQLVVRAADELARDHEISEGTWRALGRHFDDRGRMDLVFTVGCYALLAVAVNTFGVEPEHA